jgi:iron-sulfur cluster assembly protein
VVRLTDTRFPEKEVVAPVLTLTPTAAEAVRRLVDSAPTEGAEGLRIAPGHAMAEGTSLEISIVDGPEIDDQEVMESGAHVFLEPEVAEFMEDKVLDAELEDSGVRFSIRDQDAFDPESNGHP